MKPDLIMFTAEELFKAIESGRLIVFPGNHKITAIANEGPNGEMLYTFCSHLMDVGPVVGSITLRCLELIVPTVHMNGTGGAELLDDVTNNLTAINRALAALNATPPHQRDYYVNDPDESKYRLAREQHINRIARLQDIAKEYELIAENICDQMERRA